MQLSKNIRKISWLAADKATAVLYGVASMALLQVTDSKELGLFTLFNNLNNLILILGSSLSMPALLQFSANKSDLPLVNSFALFNLIFVSLFFVLILFLLQIPLSEILNEPRFVEIVSAVPFLVLFSIPRNFFIAVFVREVKLFQLFMVNLAYFGVMSSMIFYNILCDNFLSNLDIIHINYWGCISSVVVGLFLARKHLHFAWPFSAVAKNTTIKYKDTLSFSLKYSISGMIANAPKLADVYLVQLFFGTAVVGLYAPAKTVFRFVEDLVYAVGGNVYSTVVKCFSANDIPGVNSVFSKAISVLTLLFAVLTLVLWLTGDYFFQLFLPEKFISAMPIIKVLMLSSAILPITMLQTALSANNQLKSVAKYGLQASLGWLVAFVVIGNVDAPALQLTALPYITFVLILAVQLFRHSCKQHGLRFAQIFRIIPDTYRFVQSKFKKHSRDNK